MVAPPGDLSAGMVAGVARTPARHGGGAVARAGRQFCHRRLQDLVGNGTLAGTCAPACATAIAWHCGAGTDLRRRCARHPSIAAPICRRLPEGSEPGTAATTAPDSGNRTARHPVSAAG